MRWVAALLLSVVLALPLGAAQVNVSKTTRNFSFGVMSDTHYGDAAQDSVKAKTDSLFKWFERQTPLPSAILITGDLTIGGNLGADSTTAYTVFSAYQDSTGIMILPVPGNHDTKLYTSANGLGEAPYVATENPWRLLTNQLYPGLFQGRTYYTYDINTVRLLACNANPDTCFLSVGDTLQAYWNCNPPGYNLAYYGGNGSWTPNTDWAGFTDTTSTQVAWLTDQIQSWTGIHSIAGFQRSPYSPLNYADAAAGLRPLMRAPRYTTLARFTRLGVQLMFDGDVHVPGVTNAVYKNAANASGTVYVTTKSGYASRAIDVTNDQAFGGTNEYQWPDASYDTYTDKKAYAAMVRVEGDLLDVQIVACLSGETPYEMYRFDVVK